VSATRDAGLGRQHRVAGSEHQPQHVVADVVVDGGDVGDGHGRRLVRDRLVLLLDTLASAKRVDRAVLRGGHEPRTGVGWHTVRGPRLECGDQRILRELLGEPDVADHARDSRNHACGLDTPDRLDSAMGRRIGHGFTCLHDSSKKIEADVDRTAARSSPV
jgi:hypothetical protein